MKVKIKGVVGIVLEMKASTNESWSYTGLYNLNIIYYNITIMEHPGKDVTFSGVLPEEIEYVGK